MPVSPSKKRIKNLAGRRAARLKQRHPAAKQSRIESSDEDPELARVDSGQMLLPGQDARQICKSIRLPWANARALHRRGLLSFNPEKTSALNEAQEVELVFLGKLIAHRCSPTMLHKLLRELHRPYSYDLNRMSFDWSTQRWRFRPDDDEDPEENFYAVLERLEEKGDRQTLLAIREWADDALDLANDRAGFFAHEGEILNQRTTP